MSSTTAAVASTGPTIPTLPEDQLLELLVQLQKSPPAQAKAILEQQPPIACALVPLMAKLGVVDVDVLRRVLGGFSGSGIASGTSGPAAAAPSAPYSITTPPPTIPIQPPAIMMPAYGQATYSAPTAVQPTAYGNEYQLQHQQQQSATPPVPLPVRAPQPSAPVLPVQMMNAMAAFPEEQKEMIMRVMQMTPDQIRALPPQEQGIMMQLRATLGMPVE